MQLKLELEFYGRKCNLMVTYIGNKRLDKDKNCVFKK